MRWLTLISSATLIVALNAILLLGATFPDADSIRPVLNGVVHLIHLGLVVSSPLLGIWYWRAGSRWLGVAFGMNLVVLAVSAVVRVAWGIFPPLVLFGADVTWLNLYLVCLARDHDRFYRASR